MAAKKDVRIRELGQAVLSLRRDLVFAPERRDGEVQYQVEDPVCGKFYRLGLLEYTFVSLLDGRTTVSQAIRLTAAAHTDQSFSESEAAALCKWLIETGLASTTESRATARLARWAREDAESVAGKWLNPLVIRRSLLQPDSLLDRIGPLFGWMYSRWGVVLWLGLIATALFQLAADRERFLASSQGVLAPRNWLWLFGAWIVLKIWHELGHALVCRKFGGSVREFGVMFVLLAPIAYVDVTSSWRFRSKWQRILVSFAGMYNELMIAAVAAVVWSFVRDGVVAHVCYGIILMSSVTTILVNANPLMRFDGYYILADWLEIPNLQSHGRSYLQNLARKYVLGLPVALPTWSRRRRAWIRGYAIASFAWRVFVCATLLIITSVLFHGAGLLLSLAAAVIWFGLPVLRFLRYLLFGNPTEQPNRLRFALTIGATLLLAAILLSAPWPGRRRAYGVVEYAPLTVVRAESAGFYRRLAVSDGQQVNAGDLLAVLENRELRNELEDLELAIRQSELRSHRLKREGRLAEHQAEVEKSCSLEKQRQEKLTQVQSLNVRSPVPGVVVSRNLDMRLGSYVEKGDEILALGDEQLKELKVCVRQDDVDCFIAGLQSPLCVRTPGVETTQAVLARLAPRAALRPPHFALCATFGGPLAVRPTPPGERTDDPADQFELVEPSFEGDVVLGREQSVRFRAGQRASVSLGGDDSVAAYLYGSTARWVRDLVRHCGEGHGESPHFK
ncbi:MAG: biotin/lipoyl-binding protein [Pirellulaceae bacterium]